MKKILVLMLCFTFLFAGIGSVKAAPVENYDQAKNASITSPSLRTLYARATKGTYKGLGFGSTYTNIKKKLGKPSVDFFHEGKRFLMYGDKAKNECAFLVLTNNKLIYFCDIGAKGSKAITSRSVKRIFGEPWREQHVLEKAEGKVETNLVSYYYGKEDGKKLLVSWESKDLVGYSVAKISQEELNEIGRFILIFLVTAVEEGRVSS